MLSQLTAASQQQQLLMSLAQQSRDYPNMTNLGRIKGTYPGSYKWLNLQAAPFVPSLAPAEESIAWFMDLVKKSYEITDLLEDVDLYLYNNRHPLAVYGGDDYREVLLKLNLSSLNIADKIENL